MIFRPTPLRGAVVVDLEMREDERGGFARTFCAREFAANGLKPLVAQCNVSYNRHKGTLRGMHLQAQPAAETKLVRCTRGAVYDVIIDLRPGSPSYLRHFGIELDASTRTGLYIPEGFAHGFITLSDETEVSYVAGEYYTPSTELGYRHDDPAFGIQWPIPVSVISPKDAAWPFLHEHAQTRNPDPW